MVLVSTPAPPQILKAVGRWPLEGLREALGLGLGHQLCDTWNRRASQAVLQEASGQGAHSSRWSRPGCALQGSSNSPTPCWLQAFGGQIGCDLDCGPPTLTHMCPNPSWPAEDRACLAGLPVPSPLRPHCQALLYSLCSENSVQPLVVPFGVT